MAEHDKEQPSRDRAYRLWEQEGRKDGDHERHWHQASSEIDADQTSQDGGNSQGQSSENNAQEGGGLGGGMDAASAQGIASGIQPGGMTPGAKSSFNMRRDHALPEARHTHPPGVRPVSAPARARPAALGRRTRLAEPAPFRIPQDRA